MLEFKIIPVSIRGKNKLAIVLWSIQAEPDAVLGVWCSTDMEDCYIIAESTEKAIRVITELNISAFAKFPGYAIQQQIKDFLIPKPFSVTINPSI